MSEDIQQITDDSLHATSTGEEHKMGLPKPKPYFTVDQYLAIERSSQDRCEYLDGEIYLMAGESLQHGDISVNVVGLLFNQLKGEPCRAPTKDTKIRSGPVPKLHLSTSGLYSYPDVVVVCDEPKFHDDQKDVILNPTAIVEVLSPTTQAFDRGEKWIATRRGTLRSAIICLSRGISRKSNTTAGSRTAHGLISGTSVWKPVSQSLPSSAC